MRILEGYEKRHACERRSSALSMIGKSMEQDWQEQEKCMVKKVEAKLRVNTEACNRGFALGMRSMRGYRCACIMSNVRR